MMRTRSHTRWSVTLLFGVAAAFTGAHAAANVSHALAHVGTRAWLIAAYGILRTGVALAFALFTIGRMDPRRPSRSPVAFLACATALAAIVGFGEPGNGTPSGTLIGGELVAVAFGAWLLVSALYLGRSFGVLPEARALVTRGPYRISRHPVYLGEMGACAGLAIAAPSPRNAAILLTVLGAQLVRMRLEERALTEAFPAYADYARVTPRLVPRARFDLGPARAGASSVAASHADDSRRAHRVGRRWVSLLALSVSVLGGVTATQAAIHAHAGAKHPKKAAKTVGGLRAPSLLTPANGAQSQQVPTLTWSAVSGASEYEYQLSADPHFSSIVLGTGPGLGSSKTHNLAASLSQAVADGSYYWRVRALAGSRRRGPWSSTRRLLKRWTDKADLLTPASGSAIAWPSAPLVLSWTPVAGATEYIITVAADRALSNIVVGSATSSQKTHGTVFALPSTLHEGEYYWAITPIDAQGHHGERSAIASFTWYWPTSTTTEVNDLNPDPRVFEPLFSWAAVPGAARYEVEVNSAKDFPAGSKWCCTKSVIGTSFAPTEVLANNQYYWRVRAVDAQGNAGAWNYGRNAGEPPGPERQLPGRPFTKAFDSATPSIPNLTLSDAHGTPQAPGSHTAEPIITWSPVPGAASYEVQVTRYTAGHCDWSARFAKERQIVQTATTAWTPLDEPFTHVGPTAWPEPDNRTSLAAGFSYCARVLARTDHDAMGNQVVSEWTQLGGLDQPAFTFEPQPPATTQSGLETPSSAYLLPLTGANTTSTPLFTWERVPGASYYYVVVARDAGFTDVVDVASTAIPAYAPELGREEPLDDETTAYYWAVIPFNANGEESAEPPFQDAPHNFNKSSIPPSLTSPAERAQVSNQPTFRWSPAEGVLNYTLQVSADPTFGKPIESVKTDSTAYTSVSTYPANVRLYWRVRANDAASRNEGLNWSPTGEFERTLPVPSPAASTTEGQGLPVRSWAAVPGATQYGLHVELPSGTTKDYTLDSTAFTPTELYGNGRWHWKVRAEFPTTGVQTVSGPYFEPPQPFVHTLAPPTGAVGEKKGSRIVISWNPDPYAREYEVDVSQSSAFGVLAESRRTYQTAWAPNIDLSKSANKGTLYWRVAAVEEGNNVGPYAEGRFVPPRPKAKCVVKKVKIGKRIVKKCVVLKKTKKHG